ncbi:hypothetical protein OUZ56_032944 [Daphnia magna]|uniref:Uncharacterized protein n=1 Tax=Daphnia magna TaxID=35525 RepID=A0ABQ9ZX99_9CRUS|nr:hypothetical protein OUZ56_032944 [Daphnia magna]
MEVSDFVNVLLLSVFSRYPGYARYRDLYPQHLARLLWWLESGEDIFYPTPRSAVFLPECLLEEFEDSV